MLTLARLIRGTLRLRSSLKVVSGCYVDLISKQRFTDSLLFEFEVESETTDDLYTVFVEFPCVHFSKRRVVDHVKLDFDNAEACFVQRLRYEKDQILRVRCDCEDYRFTWAQWNKKKGGMYGPDFPPYRRVTDTRPERNPMHTPGACKHVFGCLRRLVNIGLLLPF
jgi:hypothetical protein